MVYLCASTDSNATSQFFASKTRVSPANKEQTIPRLELLSSVLLGRLINSVHKALSQELRLGTTLCYTDSNVAFYWIRGVRKEWKQFVQNRVNEVRNLVKLEQSGLVHLNY